MTTTKKRVNPSKLLHILANVGGWIPLAILLVQFFTNNLGFNPVNTILKRTGRYAVLFLILSLTITPLRKILKLNVIYRLRKPLGLFAALYAVLHFATYAIWDFQLDLNLIWRAMIDNLFILIGAVALLILIVLAGTSFKKLQKNIGRTWVWLHRTVYLAAVMVILHYLLAIKGDLLTLQGNYTQPLIAAGVLLVLFILRIPWVVRALNRLFKQQERV
jgi:sulfoxide reductase heme-binding subunit YedZ